MLTATRRHDSDAARIKDVPVWAFEGKDDNVVPPLDVIDMVEAIRAAGGHPHDCPWNLQRN